MEAGADLHEDGFAAIMIASENGHAEAIKDLPILMLLMNIILIDNIF